MHDQRWQDRIILVAGLWSISSSWLLGAAVPHGASANAITWNFLLGGAAAVTLSLAASASFQVGRKWRTSCLAHGSSHHHGVLEFAAADVANWSAVLSGAMIALLAAWRALWALEEAGNI
ncbi:SPW repeat domain-containing protein [Mesorhizobium sp. L-8-3]|uniref:SPW repeat domain-containing protein n=1 Tax=unclassified Mesorhizobium TaxID=325217 RepID=UPI00406C2FE1